MSATSDARIEAAGLALRERHPDLRADIKRTATLMLAAADEADAPLVETLRGLVNGIDAAEAWFSASRLTIAYEVDVAAAVRIPDQRGLVGELLSAIAQAGARSSEYRCPACGSRACDCEGKNIPEGDRARWEAARRADQ